MRCRFYRCPLASSRRHKRRCGKFCASERLNQTIKRYFRCFCDHEKYPLIVRLNPSTDSGSGASSLDRSCRRARWCVPRKHQPALKWACLGISDTVEQLCVILLTPSSCFQMQPDLVSPLIHPSFYPGVPESPPLRSVSTCAQWKNLRSTVAHHPQSANFSEKSEAFPPQTDLSPVQHCSSPSNVHVSHLLSVHSGRIRLQTCAPTSALCASFSGQSKSFLPGLSGQQPSREVSAVT